MIDYDSEPLVDDDDEPESTTAIGITPFNLALLRDAVLWVEKEDTRPREQRTWNQGVWSAFDAAQIKQEGERYTCGTVACVAGHLAIEEGMVRPMDMTFTWNLDEFGTPEAVPSLVDAPDDEIEIHYTGYEIDLDACRERFAEVLPEQCPCGCDSGLGLDWPDVGRLLLGITHAEANALFSGQNSAHRVRAVAETIALRHDEVL